MFKINKDKGSNVETNETTNDEAALDRRPVMNACLRGDAAESNMKHPQLIYDITCSLKFDV